MCSISSSFHSLRLRTRSQRPVTKRRSIHYPSRSTLKPYAPEFGRQRCNLLHTFAPMASAVDEDIGDASFSLEDDSFFGGNSDYIISSSEGEDSDSDAFLNPFAETELPLNRERLETPDAALTLTAHRLANIQKGYRKDRTRRGVSLTLGLATFLSAVLLFFDWCSWRIVRLPLKSFYLSFPFAVSTFVSATIGCFFVPIVDGMKIHHVIMREGSMHSSRRAVPTIGGLFFIPVGITIVKAVVRHRSDHVNAAGVVTLCVAAIGLANDIFQFAKNPKHRLPGWIKLLLHVAVGTCFSLWLDSTNLPTPYSMKLLVPLPPPFGLIQLGKCYFVLTVFCFVAMPNGIKLTDRADGLVGGVSALAFVGMSIAVLPICPELAVFGASMAGASVGFLFHNRYKSSILMGDVGSLGLGGALSVMAACTGMFFPLFISAGVFILESLTVVIQVAVLKATIRRKGATRLISRVPPLHQLLRSYGLKIPVIVASAYVVSGILAIFAGYVGLVSA